MNGNSLASEKAIISVQNPIPPTPTPTNPPSIITQPTSQTKYIGDSVTFDVYAEGTQPLMYLWFKDNVAIQGAVTNNYTLPSVALTDAGDYSVTVSNSVGSITSNVVTLTVNEPTPTLPVITEQPSSQTIVVGDGAVFNVNATGEPPIAYQWFKDDVEIQGATGNTHIIQTSALTDAGVYKATVTNIAGTVTSNTATLTVNEPNP